MADAIYGIPASFILLVGGLVACLAGYRLFRVVLAVAGFVGGALGAGAIYSAASGVTSVLVMLAGGLVGAAVMIAAYFFGVALVGAVLGATIAHLWLMGGDREPTVLIIVLFSVGGALLTMTLQRYVLIVGTTFAGAWAAVAGALVLIGHPGVVGSEVNRLWMPLPFGGGPGERWIRVSWLVLAILGLVVQLGWTAGDKGRLARRRQSRK
jgi:hypothetical protein